MTNSKLYKEKLHIEYMKIDEYNQRFGKYGPGNGVPRKKSFGRKALEAVLIGAGVVGSMFGANYLVGCADKRNAEARDEPRQEETIPVPGPTPRIVPIDEYDTIEPESDPEKQEIPVQPEEKLDKQKAKPRHRLASKGTVVLDPGHGMGNRQKGKLDAGATYGANNEHKESEYVLAQAKKIKEYLEARGYTVKLTREDEKTPVKLWERNVKDADVFVSLHYNAPDSRTNTSANGTETYYNSEQGRELAGYIHPRLVKAIGTRDRGIKQSGYRVLRGKVPASVLVETGFISNPEDRAKTSGYADEKAIAEGIHAYLAQKAKENSIRLAVKKAVDEYETSRK